MQILATDHGTHPADKWAIATANQIVPTDGVTDGKRIIAALKLRAAVAETLMDSHQTLQDGEKSALNADTSGAHLSTVFDASDYGPDALTAIVALSVGSLWEDHFADPAVQAEITNVLTNHFNTHAHVERQHWADTSTCDAAVAFRALHHYPTVVPTEDETVDPGDTDTLVDVPA